MNATLFTVEVPYMQNLLLFFAFFEGGSSELKFMPDSTQKAANQQMRLYLLKE